MIKWTTRIEPTRYNMPRELHVVLYAPLLNEGCGDCIEKICIPEEEPHWLDFCRWLADSGDDHCRLKFLCDTAEQAHSVAARATPILTTHRRVSLEMINLGHWGVLQ